MAISGDGLESEMRKGNRCGAACVHGRIVLGRTGVPSPCLPRDLKRTHWRTGGRPGGVPGSGA